MTLRTSLFAKILLWFFLNLVVLGLMLFGIFTWQWQLPKDSFWFGGNRLDYVAGRVSDELRSSGGADVAALLARHGAVYGVDLVLFTGDGERVAGPPVVVPPEVLRYVGGAMPPPSPPGRPPNERPRPGPGPHRRPPPRAQPVFTERTENPTRYWSGVRVPLFEPGHNRPGLATLLAVSDSMSGHGLYFDVRPWLLLATLVLGVSILLWVPFVRGLTGSLREMTRATERIADEQFDVRVDESRSDELGRLGVAINHLSSRLAAFVGGQKRFLGDIAHELNSPLGRLQVALGILEERVAQGQGAYVADALEEVRTMSRLVSELLAFSRAGMRTRELPLAPVALGALVQSVREREAGGADVTIAIDAGLQVLAHADLLARAVANVLRNAVRYAGDSGPVHVSAEAQGREVALRVADSGPGVPGEAVSRLFDPFFRLEPDRARATGGSGLGLAIVKSCVEACRGRVSARNLEPHGLEVTLTVPRA
jgi:two-component system, OmpR family, sensor histidine kinase CpxA